MSEHTSATGLKLRRQQGLWQLNISSHLQLHLQTIQRTKRRKYVLTDISKSCTQTRQIRNTLFFRKKSLYVVKYLRARTVIDTPKQVMSLSPAVISFTFAFNPFSASVKFCLKVNAVRFTLLFQCWFHAYWLFFVALKFYIQVYWLVACARRKVQAVLGDGMMEPRYSFKCFGQMKHYGRVATIPIRVRLTILFKY